MSEPPVEPTRIPSLTDPDSVVDTAVPSHARASESTATAFEPPGFDLRDELARGGMGAVYRAHDRVFHREVAVKVLLPEWRESPEAVSRFATEARITGRLQHPGVPPAHHLGTMPDGRPFLAMKLIRGRTLSDLLKERTSPADDMPRFLQAFEQICQAVGYAHSEGVIHRDIKPQNVMVGAFGEVQVMDWGLAKEMRSAEFGIRNSDNEPTPKREPHSVDSRSPSPSSTPHSPFPIPRSQDSDLTRAGSIIGTPMYMPPEQARGESHRAGPWSDVFSLGGVLCLILTGKPPYSGNRHQVLTFAELGMVEEAFLRLDGCGADAELIALCKRCLARDPADRPVDGKAVADAIAAYRSGVETRLRIAESEKAAAEARAVEEANTRREAVAKIAEQRKKRHWQLASLGIAALLVIAAGAFAWWQDAQDSKRREEQAKIESDRRAEEFRQQAEQQQRDQIERDRLDRNRQVVESLLVQADSDLQVNDIRAAGTILSQVEKRFEEGGADVLKPRFARAQVDLAMLRELDRLDSLRWTSLRGKFQDEEADRQLPEAFLRYGIDPMTMSENEIAACLNATPIRERLVGALDRLFLTTKNDKLSAVVYSLLRSIDPDEFRDEVRLAIVLRDLKLLQGIAERPAALSQPPRFAILLGELSEHISFPVRQDILLDTHLRTPTDHSLLMSLGRVYPIEQKPGATNRIGWYRAALAVRPDHVGAWNGLGIAQRDFGDFRSAADSFRKAIHLDSSYVIARVNLGSTLCDLREFDDAICVLRTAVRLDPEDATAWYNLGTALNEAGKLKPAAEALRTSLKLDPTDAKTHYNLGCVLDDLKDAPGAEKEYWEAIKFDPNHAGAHYNLGIRLFARKEYAAAVAEYRAALRSRKDHADTHYNLGNALLMKGDVDDAIAAYREVIRLEPKNADAHWNLGVALEKKGKREDALASYREAVRLNPEKFAELAKKLPLEKK